MKDLYKYNEDIIGTSVREGDAGQILQGLSTHMDMQQLQHLCASRWMQNGAAVRTTSRSFAWPWMCAYAAAWQLRWLGRCAVLHKQVPPGEDHKTFQVPPIGQLSSLNMFPFNPALFSSSQCLAGIRQKKAHEVPASSCCKKQYKCSPIVCAGCRGWDGMEDSSD